MTDVSGTVKRIAVIMAGGTGERFWPLSRSGMPKQLLPIGPGGSTLLELAIGNISPLFPPENIHLATGRLLADAVLKSGLPIVSDAVIVEPEKRNTAGCLVWTVANLLARYGGDGNDIVMGVFPADHVITEPAIFRTLADAALNAAQNQDALVTFAVQPTRPETGYGYLELDDDCLPGSETRYGAPVHHVRRFCEKPERAVAEEYIATGRYFWNSGMFFWRLSSFVEELAEADPAMACRLAEITDTLAKGDSESAAQLFYALPSISIDYALMEKSKHVIAIKAGFNWDDIGSWDALERIQAPDADGNILVGDPVVLDSRDTVVYNVSGAESMAVGVIGADNLAVVVTPDGVLVCRKDRAQDVRKIVAALKDRGSPQV